MSESHVTRVNIPLVDVLSWPVVCLHCVGSNFLAPSSDWHLERGE